MYEIKLKTFKKVINNDSLYRHASFFPNEQLIIKHLFLQQKISSLHLI